MKRKVQAQVLIVAYGRNGLQRVAALPHPQMEGIQYIVSWQYGNESPDFRPESLAARPDFVILPTPTKGVSVNRNLALRAASAPICIMSDDDVEYTPEGIRSILRAFDRRPDCHMLTFRYHSDRHPRPYPDRETDLATHPKGYWLCGFEMAFRLDAIRKNGIRFNERFGVGCEFVAGEEDLFLHDLLKKGLTARFVPVTCVTHQSDTTAARRADDLEYIRTKGAVFSILFPFSWPLRMLTHTARHTAGSKTAYLRAWLKGVRQLRNR